MAVDPLQRMHYRDVSTLVDAFEKNHPPVFVPSRGVLVHTLDGDVHLFSTAVYYLVYDTNDNHWLAVLRPGQAAALFSGAGLESWCVIQREYVQGHEMPVIGDRPDPAKLSKRRQPVRG